MPENTLKQNTLAHLLGWAAVVMAAALLFAAAVSAQELSADIQAALDRGDTATALNLLDKQIELDPSYYYNYYEKGRIFFERRQFQRALKEFETAVDKKDKHWPSVEYLGRTYLELGQLDKAEETFKRGIKKARDEKDLFEYLEGLVLMAREDYSAADVSFRKALAIDSMVADYHIGLGDANFYQGIPALAVSEYEKALALDTAGTEVYYHWADACLEMKDYACAMEKLRVVLSKDSTFAAAWRRAGNIYFKAARSSRTLQDRNARYMDAIGAYTKYFELSHAVADSSTVREYFETAMAYTNIRRYEDAIPYFEKVLSIPYEPRDIYFYYGKALWGTRDFDKAAEVLQKQIQWAENQSEGFSSRVGDEDVYKYLGDCYFYRQPKDFSNAVRYYEKSLEADPNQPRILQNTAVALHNLRRYGEALHYYDKRIDLGLDSADAGILKNASLCALSIAGEEQSNSDEELPDEEDAGAYVPPGVDPNTNYYEVAVGYMEQYLDFVPDDTGVVDRLANTYLYQLQNCEKGVANYERLLTLDPNNCGAKKSIGYAYFLGDICNKDLDKTLRYLLQAYDCMTSSGAGACEDASLVKWIAQAYHLRAVDGTGNSNSDYKNAFEWYGRVLKCNPNDVEAKKGQEDTRFEFN
jgi:tetratricopeptide (TPR) repeat protein